MHFLFMVGAALGVPWPPPILWVASAVGLWLLARRKFGVRYLLVQLAAVDLLLFTLITAAALAMRLGGIGAAWQPLGPYSTVIALVVWLCGLMLLGWLGERHPVPGGVEKLLPVRGSYARRMAGFLALAFFLLPTAMVVSAPFWGRPVPAGNHPGWLLGLTLAAPFYFEPFWRELTRTNEYSSRPLHDGSSAPLLR